MTPAIPAAGTRCGPACHRPTQSQAHCSVCHRTMRSVTDFDVHRRNGGCIDPDTLGLVERGGLWATPEGHERRREDARRLASMQSQRSTAAVEARTGEVGSSAQGDA